MACPAIKNVTVKSSKSVTKLLDIVQKVALKELMVLIVLEFAARAVVTTRVKVELDFVQHVRQVIQEICALRVSAFSLCNFCSCDSQ